MLNVDNEIVKEWQMESLQVMADAQRLAPVASSTLQGSANTLSAKITDKGVESAVLFKVPYAAKLNDKDSGIRLKNRGELSYYAGGTKVKKAKKGRLGYLDIAVSKGIPFFNKLTQKAVSKQFLKI